MISVKLFLASVLSCALILPTSGCASMATYWGEPAVQNQEVQAAAPSVIQPAQITPEQLEQLVAPMDKNLSWTSALGDAYFNNQQDVLNAVQVCARERKLPALLKPRRNRT